MVEEQEEGHVPGSSSIATGRRILILAGVRMDYSPAFRQPRSVTFMIILLFQYSHDISGRSGPGLRRFRPKENSGRSAGVLCH